MKSESGRVGREEVRRSKYFESLGKKNGEGGVTLLRGTDVSR